MTLTYHARKRMNQRRITLESILECIEKGFRYTYNDKPNAFTFRYEGLVVVTSLDCDTIVTVIRDTKRFMNNKLVSKIFNCDYILN